MPSDGIEKIPQEFNMPFYCGRMVLVETWSRQKFKSLAKISGVVAGCDCSEAWEPPQFQEKILSE